VGPRPVPSSSRNSTSRMDFLPHKNERTVNQCQMNGFPTYHHSVSSRPGTFCRILAVCGIFRSISMFFITYLLPILWIFKSKWFEISSTVGV
jgi:hypothetical protein